MAKKFVSANPGDNPGFGVPKIPRCYSTDPKYSHLFKKNGSGNDIHRKACLEERIMAKEDPLAYRVCVALRAGTPLDEYGAYLLVLDILQRGRRDLAQMLLDGSNFSVVRNYHKARDELNWVLENKVMAHELTE